MWQNLQGEDLQSFMTKVRLVFFSFNLLFLSFSLSLFVFLFSFSLLSLSLAVSLSLSLTLFLCVERGCVAQWCRSKGTAVDASRNVFLSICFWCRERIRALSGVGQGTAVDASRVVCFFDTYVLCRERIRALSDVGQKALLSMPHVTFVFV